MDSMQVEPRPRPLNWMIAVLAVAILLLLGGILFLLFRAESTPRYSGPVTKIRLGAPALGPDLSELIWVAQDQKFFRANGLDVTVTSPPSTLEIQQKLTSGELDLGVATEFSYTTAILGTNPLKAKIIAVIDKARSIEVIARKESGIAKQSDLKGKKVAVFRKTANEFFLSTFLTYSNLSLTDVQLVDLAPNKAKEAILAGQVDAAVISDPFAYETKQSLGSDAISWSAQGNVDFNWVLMGADTFVATNPQALERFLQALVQAEAYVKHHKTASQALLAKKFKLDKAYVASAWPKHNYSVSLDQSLLLTMEDASRWRINNGLTSRTTVPNYLKLMHFDALEAVDSERITIIR